MSLQHLLKNPFTVMFWSFKTNLVFTAIFKETHAYNGGTLLKVVPSTVILCLTEDYLLILQYARNEYIKKRRTDM
jgi:hypothetical protein